MTQGDSLITISRVEPRVGAEEEGRKVKHRVRKGRGNRAKTTITIIMEIVAVMGVRDKARMARKVAAKAVRMTSKTTTR